MPTYNFAFRPSTYFDTPASLLGNVKGEHRRRLAQQAIANDDKTAPLDFLLQEKLSDEERQMMASIDPRLMGGEYLADYEPGEVEIARVALDSTTGDVISVRAKRDGNKIVYRVADEYSNKYTHTPSESDEPLTMLGLIGLIDSGRAEGWDSEGLTNTCPATVSSAFYPQLEQYYED